MPRREEPPLADILRKDLKEAGPSIRKLARILAGDGADDGQVESERRQLSKYLNEGTLPTPEKARRIARALGKPDRRYVRTIDRRGREAARTARLEEENEELRATNLELETELARLRQAER